VGTVCIGIASDTGARARRFRFPGNRGWVRALAVQTALDMLRRTLQQAPDPTGWR
jgi:nicotinamide mononucleotide (NMN) deamidase PncC